VRYHRAPCQTFYLAALSAIRRDNLARAYYARNQADGKRYPQALVAPPRTLVDLVWPLLFDHREFTPTAPQPAIAACQDH
jgi:hypothetical protein